MEEISKLLTITVPAYNVEDYLKRCLESIAKCKSKLSKIEVLIVNDGSKDHTRDVAEKFVHMYPDTFALIEKENGGHGSAINSGIVAATGMFFMVLDGDDWLDDKSLDELVTKIEQVKNEKIDLISYHYNQVNMVTGISVPMMQRNICYDKVYQFDELPVNDIYFALASTCYRTAILQEMNLRLQENTYYVDVEYILLPIPFVQTVLFLNIYLYKYFVGNSQQSIYIPTMVKRFEHHNRVIHRVIDSLFSTELEDTHKQYVLQIVDKLLYTHYAIMLVYNDDKEEGISCAREFDNYLESQSKLLYDRTKKSIPFLRVYRKYNFSIKKVENARFYRAYLKFTDRVINIIKKIRRIVSHV